MQKGPMSQPQDKQSNDAHTTQDDASLSVAPKKRVLLRKQSSHLSALYLSKQRIIGEKLRLLFSLIKDDLYFQLTSAEEQERVQKKCLQVLLSSSSSASSSFSSLSSKQVEESLLGVKEKLKINGRHFDSEMLWKLWSQFLSTERLDSNMREDSLPHAMVFLLMRLSRSPSLAGKRSSLEQDDTSTESVLEPSEAEDEGSDEDDEALEFASLEEERRQWWEDFNESSDSEFEDDDDECHDEYLARSGGSTNPVSQSEHVKDDDTNGDNKDDDSLHFDGPDPLYQMDGGDLPYGGHISAYSSRHYPSNSVTSSSTVVSPSAVIPGSVLLEEGDVCVMVLEMLLGCGNDLFTTSDLCSVDSDTDRFSLSITASRAGLTCLSHGALQQLLTWFLTLGNCLHWIRELVREATPVHNRSREPPRLVVEALAIRQVLENVLGKFESFAYSQQRKIMMPAGSAESRVNNSGRVTLLRLLGALRRWEKLLNSAAKLSSRMLKVASVKPQSPQASEALSCHEQLIALMSQLQHDCDVLHLLHCHDQLSLLQPARTRHVDEEEPNDVLALELSIQPSYEVDFFREACFNLQTEYFSSVLRWLHSGGEKENGFRGVHSPEIDGRAWLTSGHCDEPFLEIESSMLPCARDLQADEMLKSFLKNALESVSDVRILKKYGSKRKSQRMRDVKRNKEPFDTRNMLNAGAKCLHALLSLHSRIPRSSRGVEAVSNEGGEDMYVIDSSRYNRRRRTALARRLRSPTGDGREKESEAEPFEDTSHIHPSYVDANNWDLLRSVPSMSSSTDFTMFRPEILRENQNKLIKPFGESPRLSSRVNKEHCKQDKTRTSRVEDVPYCMPFLTSVLPSSTLLLKLFVTRPLQCQLTCLQSRAVNILSTQFQLFEHFQFLKSVFLLGDVAYVCGSLREHIFRNRGEDLHGRGKRSLVMKRHYDNLLREISSSIRQRVIGMLPSGFSEALVSVSFLDYEDFVGGHSFDDTSSLESSSQVGSESGSRRPSFALSEAERMFNALSSLTLEIHYPSPMSEVIPPVAVSSYNSIMQFLLKIMLCCWTSEKLWKESTGSCSFLTTVCSNGVTEDSLAIGKLRHLHRTCMVALQHIIFVTRALESYYLNQIHNVLFQRLSAAACSAFASSPSVARLAESHASFLKGTASCTQFLQSLVVKVVHEGIVAMGVFDEAHAAAEANRGLIHTSGASSALPLDNMTYKIIHSRLTHAANKMSRVQGSIVQFVDTVESLHGKLQDLDGDDMHHVVALRCLLGSLYAVNNVT